MKNNFSKFFILILLTTAKYLFANNPGSARLGRIQVSGSGCQYGSSHARLSRNANAINISISNFQASNNQTRAQCNIGVPIHVPRGYQVSIRRATYSGQNKLAARSSANLQIRHFFGRNRASYSQKFLGKLNRRFSLQDNSLGRQLGWSSCGRNVDFQINASLRTNKQALSRANLFSYQLNWRRCR